VPYRSVFSDPTPLTETLTAEELRVLQLICAGETSGRIARDLGISFQSIVGHRMRILQKMDTVRLAMATMRVSNAASRVSGHPIAVEVECVPAVPSAQASPEGPRIAA